MTKKTIDVEAQSVSFAFDNEQIETVSLKDLPESIVTQLALHGLSQKIGDSYAGAKSATADSDIDPADWSQSQAAGVIKQLTEGEWTVRTGGGSGGAVTDLARALSEASGAALEDCIAKLADADKETKAELRKHPDVKAILERLRAERAAEKAKAAAANAGSGPDLSEMFA